MAVPFGIEEEFFVLHRSGRAPTPDEIDALLIKLCERSCRAVAVSPSNVPGAAAIDVHGQRAVIKTEHCTHVLEVAFPPLTCPMQFRELWKHAFGILAAALDSLGLQIHPGSVLAEAPPHYLRPNENDPGGHRQRRLIERPSTGSQLFIPELFAVICSTQVSLGVPWPDIAANLESYYALEYLFPLLYSQGRRFGQHQAHSLRPLIMQANFTAEFGQVGFPADIRQSVAENDIDAFARRSYAYIARRENRVEFRSADCQGDVDRVLEITALRLLIHQLAINGDQCPYNVESRELFLNSCIGQFDLTLLGTHGEVIHRRRHLLDSVWQLWLNQLLEKMRI